MVRTLGTPTGAICHVSTRQTAVRCVNWFRSRFGRRRCRRWGAVTRGGGGNINKRDVRRSQLIPSGGVFRSRNNTTIPIKLPEDKDRREKKKKMLKIRLGKSTAPRTIFIRHNCYNQAIKKCTIRTEKVRVVSPPPSIQIAQVLEISFYKRVQRNKTIFLLNYVIILLQYCHLAKMSSKTLQPNPHLQLYII